MESKKINQLATELTPALSDLTIIGDPTTGISKKITLSQMASLFTGTVEEYANLASFPLVGTADTIYIALDTNIIYRWNTGTSAYVELSPNIVTSLVFSDANGFDGTISLVGSTATLTITTALTQGSVPFIGTSGALSQDNANLFFDDTNNRLGINTNAPTTAIDVFGSGIIGRLNGTSTNNAFLGFASAGSNKWSIGNVQSDHRFRIYNEATTSELVSVLQTGEFGIGIANPLTKLHIFGGASALIANLDANTSVAKSISFRSGNSSRFNIEVSGTESGSNAGMDFYLRAYTDAGALLSTPLTISRSTGAVTLSSSLSATGATFTSTQTNLILNTTTNTSFTKLSFQENGSEKATITYPNSTFGAPTRREKLEISNLGGINFITQNAPLTPNVTINSSGNVSIGNTNDTYKLDVTGNGRFTSSSFPIDIYGTTNNYGLRINSVQAPTLLLYSSNANSSNRNWGIFTNSEVYGDFDIRQSNAKDGDMTSGANSTSRFYIRNTGLVGIGVINPISILDVRESNRTNGSNIANLSVFTTSGQAADSGGTISLGGLFDATNNAPFGSIRGGKENSTSGNYAGYLSFQTIPNNSVLTERMRITSDGFLKASNTGTYLGASVAYHEINSNQSSRAVLVVRNTASSVPAGQDILFTASPNNTTSAFLYCQDGTEGKFVVWSNGDVDSRTNSYGGWSDIKLKENISDATPKLNDLLKVKVKNYNFIGDDKKQLGVIAQELEEIFPALISETPDYEMNEETGEKEYLGTTTKSVKYSVFIPMLIKAIQEQQEQIEELKALINK